ncbi:SpoIIE family protein phosphatase [Tunturibacter empetritectus]|uniref:Serine phosphatase RsbU (Regulator of sigma subunit) n=1 Tax=Tunturiibacter lichenicola TaxID=2051959 RepID=A0A7W8N331_9BACT|nr:SpoIIE family protein phosphatase [Edaphobacter lichenicola]MBB5343699.1 serine phosphatase RsbU (regulator of sigma subunit) [Edaphobacter lichenicola]
METIKHPARLVVRDTDQTQTVTIDTLPFTIGRRADRNLYLTNSQVSREHANIYEDAEGFFIQDLGSRHGTFVNDIRKDTARLRSGDHIKLGPSGVALLFVTSPGHTSTIALFHQMASGVSTSELQKLSLFLQAAQSFNNTSVLEDIFSTMIEYTLRLTQAERGFVFLGDGPTSLSLECGFDRDGQQIFDDTKISRSIVRDAAESGQEYILGDVSGEGQPVGRESVVAHELRSVIAIPLRGRNSGRLLGLLYLDSRLRSGTLNSVDRDILLAIATEAATLVEHARLVQAERAAELLRNEMEIAASIQQSIIARHLPTFPYAKIAAKTIPCAEVGGDFYDVIPLEDGFVAIVADVSGKGVPAALLASIIQGMMYAQARSNISLVDTVTTVQSFLCSRVYGQKYVTLVALRYKQNGEVELVNGGHVPPLLIREDGTITPILGGDVPVGLLQDAAFHSISFTLPLHARLVLLSDGVTEAENPTGVQFGSIERQREFSAPDPIQAIFAAMFRFCEGAPTDDDCTLLVIDRIA